MGFAGPEARTLSFPLRFLAEGQIVGQLGFRRDSAGTSAIPSWSMGFEKSTPEHTHNKRV